jgi:hypothetical protein
MSNPIGRPKIVLSDLRDDWKEFITELFAEGGSQVEAYVGLGIDKDTFKRLVEEQPDFTETVKKGLEASEAWWTRNGRTKLSDKEFSYTGWYMNMKNRFGWKDRTETDVTTKGEALNTNPDPVAAAAFADFLKSKH